MPTHATNPLELPELLSLILSYIPIPNSTNSYYTFPSTFSSSSSSSSLLVKTSIHPKSTLLSCLLVSHTWYTTLQPFIWRIITCKDEKRFKSCQGIDQGYSAALAFQQLQKNAHLVRFVGTTTLTKGPHPISSTMCQRILNAGCFQLIKIEGQILDWKEVLPFLELVTKNWKTIKELELGKGEEWIDDDVEVEVVEGEGEGEGGGQVAAAEDGQEVGNEDEEAEQAEEGNEDEEQGVEDIVTDGEGQPTVVVNGEAIPRESTTGAIGLNQVLEALLGCADSVPDIVARGESRDVLYPTFGDHYGSGGGLYSNVERLDLDSIRFCLSWLDDLLEACPKLKKLGLMDWVAVPDPAANPHQDQKSFLKSRNRSSLVQCPTLERLYLYDSAIDAQGSAILPFAEFFKRFPNLKQLELGCEMNPERATIVAKAIRQYIPNLVGLYLDGEDEVDRLYSPILDAVNPGKLQKLTLSVQLSGIWPNLVRHFDSLTAVAYQVQWCNPIAAGRQVAQILASCRGLKKMEAYGVILDGNALVTGSKDWVCHGLELLQLRLHGKTTLVRFEENEATADMVAEQQQQNGNQERKGQDEERRETEIQDLSSSTLPPRPMMYKDSCWVLYWRISKLTKLRELLLGGPENESDDDLDIQDDSRPNFCWAIPEYASRPLTSDELRPSGFELLAKGLKDLDEFGIDWTARPSLTLTISKVQNQDENENGHRQGDGEAEENDDDGGSSNKDGHFIDIDSEGKVVMKESERANELKVISEAFPKLKILRVLGITKKEVTWFGRSRPLVRVLSDFYEE